MMMRDNSIDNLKGIGIMLVVLGHCTGIDPFLYKYLFSFHMPLFFFVTGYLSYGYLENTKFKNIVIKRIKNIYIPYLLFCVVSYFFLYCVSPLYHHTPIFNYSFNFTDLVRGIILSGSYFNKVLSGNTPLWFLPLFFMSNIVWYIILKTRRHFKYFLPVLAICLFFLSSNLQQMIRAQSITIFNISALPSGIFFMCAGYYVKKNESFFAKLENYTIIQISFFTLSLIGIVSGGHLRNIDSSLYFVIATLSVLFYFHIAKGIKNNYISWLGKHSLLILGIHGLVFGEYYRTSLYNRLSQYFQVESNAAIMGIFLDFFVVLMVSSLAAWACVSIKKIIRSKDSETIKQTVK